jgi:putative addiction module component (TIGR02574 family)
MTPRTAQLLEEALRVPDEERAALTARLIDRLGVAPEEVEAAWSIEIERRLQEIDEGQAQLITWPEARQRILGPSDESSLG